MFFICYRALTLASPEIRFHIDSETHDPIDVQTKELRYCQLYLHHDSIINIFNSMPTKLAWEENILFRHPFMG